VRVCVRACVHVRARAYNLCIACAGSVGVGVRPHNDPSAGHPPGGRPPSTPHLSPTHRLVLAQLDQLKHQHVLVPLQAVNVLLEVAAIGTQLRARGVGAPQSVNG